MVNNLPFVNKNFISPNGTRVISQQNPFGRVPLTGPVTTFLAEGGQTTGDPDGVSPEDKAAFTETQNKVKAVADQVVQGKGDGLTFKDFLMPAVLGGASMLMGGGLRHGLTAGATFMGAKRQEENRLDQLDRTFKAAEKQRRYQRATASIKGLVDKGLTKQAAKFTVQLYTDMGFEVTEKQVFDKFERDRLTKISDQAWKDLGRLRTIDDTTGALDFEVANYEKLHNEAPTEEKLQGIRDRYSRMFDAEKLSVKEQNKRFELLDAQLEGAKLSNSAARIKKEKDAGKKNTLQQTSYIEKELSRGVLSSAIRNLKPEERTALEKFQKESGITDKGDALLAALAQNEEGKTTNIRSKIPPKLYIEAYNNMLRSHPDALLIGTGTQRRRATVREVFANQSDILEAIDALELLGEVDESAELSTERSTKDFIAPTPTGGGQAQIDADKASRKEAESPKIEAAKFTDVVLAQEILDTLLDLRAQIKENGKAAGVEPKATPEQLRVIRLLKVQFDSLRVRK